MMVPMGTALLFWGLSLMALSKIPDGEVWPRRIIIACMVFWVLVFGFSFGWWLGEVL